MTIELIFGVTKQLDILPKNKLLHWHLVQFPKDADKATIKLHPIEERTWKTRNEIFLPYKSTFARLLYSSSVLLLISYNIQFSKIDSAIPKPTHVTKIIGPQKINTKPHRNTNPTHYPFKLRSVADKSYRKHFFFDLRICSRF